MYSGTYVEIVDLLFSMVIGVESSGFCRRHTHTPKTARNVPRGCVESGWTEGSFVTGLWTDMCLWMRQTFCLLLLFQEQLLFPFFDG
jgi:glycogen debranching enzyme